MSPQCLTAQSPLPLTPRRSDSRPVYEPPIFDYTWATDLEDYEKQREALLSHYSSDVVKVTTFMDLHTEWRLLEQHRYWAYEEAVMAGNDMDEEKVIFFDLLGEELKLDRTVVFREFWALGIRLVMEEGKWVVKDNDKLKRDKYAEVEQRTGVKYEDRMSRNSELGPSKAISAFASLSRGKSTIALEDSSVMSSPPPLLANKSQPEPQRRFCPSTTEATPLLSTRKPSTLTHDAQPSWPAIISRCLCS